MPPTAQATVSIHVRNLSDQLVQSFLVMTQRLDMQPVELKVPGKVNVDVVTQSNTIASLHIPAICDSLDKLVKAVADDINGGASNDAGNCLGRLLPFLTEAAETFASSLAIRLGTTKASYKLAYVTARVMLDLAQKGFCKPQEETDSKTDDRGGETSEGVGMGAGSGDKNVSSEIEEEGQVEGLQGEEEEEGPEEKQKRDKEEGDDDTMDMENDFDGKLEDGKEEEDLSQDEEEEEHDDHVGDIDPLDPGAVDEKFWGEEEKPEQGGDDLMNEKTQDQGGETELSAKEDSKEANDLKNDDQPASEDPAQDTQQNDTQQNDESNEVNDDQADDNAISMNDAGQQDEVAAPEGDNLALPEDLDLGDENEMDDGEAMSDISISAEGEDDHPDNEPEGNGISSDVEGDANEDAPEATGVGEEDSHDPDATLNQNLDMSAADNAQAQEAEESGKGPNGTAEQAEHQDDGDAEEEADQGDG